MIATNSSVSSAIIDLMREHPRLLKRAVIWGWDHPKALDKFAVTAWTYLDHSLINNLWDGFHQGLPPLRFVPIFPFEGCEIQKTWNDVWDKAIPIAKGLRIYR